MGEAVVDTLVALLESALEAATIWLVTNLGQDRTKLLS